MVASLAGLGPLHFGVTLLERQTIVSLHLIKVYLTFQISAKPHVKNGISLDGMECFTKSEVQILNLNWLTLNHTLDFLQ